MPRHDVEAGRCRACVRTRLITCVHLARRAIAVAGGKHQAAGRLHDRSGRPRTQRPCDDVGRSRNAVRRHGQRRLGVCDPVAATGHEGRRSGQQDRVRIARAGGRRVPRRRAVRFGRLAHRALRRHRAPSRRPAATRRRQRSLSRPTGTTDASSSRSDRTASSTFRSACRATSASRIPIATVSSCG